MKRSVATVIASACLALTTAPAQAVVITDCCDWATGWTFSSFSQGTGSATAVVEGSGGNPGARLNISTVTPSVSDLGYGTAVLTTSGTPAPTAGTAFTLQLDVLSGAGAFGQGQGIDLLVAQGGSVYALALGVTGFPLSTFTTLSFNGNFNAGSFSRISGGGPSTPSFDGVTTTTYGFAAGNTNSGTLTQYYDNFRLTISSIGPPAGPSIVPVPTVSAWTLATLGALVGVIAFVALRRKKSSASL